MTICVSIIAAAAVLCSLFCASCSQKGASSNKAGGAPKFVIMEKVLADAKGRNRTTMKILVPDPKADPTAALKAALDAAVTQDSTLKAAIIWAYRAREELNGSNFTVGKLEWSSDGKDFNGTAALSPNPKIEVVAK